MTMQRLMLIRYEDVGYIWENSKASIGMTLSLGKKRRNLFDGE